MNGAVLAEGPVQDREDDVVATDRPDGDRAGRLRDQRLFHSDRRRAGVQHDPTRIARCRLQRPFRLAVPAPDLVDAD